MAKAKQPSELPTDLVALFAEYAASQITLEQAQRRLLAIGQREGWSWVLSASRQQFNRLSAALLSAWGYAHYCNNRRQELIETGYPLWVFRADPDCRAEHQELDGLTLAPDHMAWFNFAHPLGWDCRCYLTGARSEGASRRLGGQPGKGLPTWATGSIDDPSMQACIDPPWRTWPLDLGELLASVEAGESPGWD